MAWACVSGARWAAPGRARTTVRFSPLTSRGPMSSASTRAVGRTGGRVVSLIALLLSASPPGRLSAQSVFSQFSYDNLKPSALQLDVGPLGGNNIRGALTGGLRLDYGLIAPHVRVLLGVSYLKADYMGIGLGAHFRHGSGPAVNGTFVQDALNEITAGLNGTLGAEFGAKRWRFTLEGRGVLSSGLSTASLRSGVMYRWATK